MKRTVFAILLLSTLTAVRAQHVLTLDSCRALALRNNKQINIAKLRQEVALNAKKAVDRKSVV